MLPYSLQTLKNKVIWERWWESCWKSSTYYPSLFASEYSWLKITQKVWGFNFLKNCNGNELSSFQWWPGILPYLGIIISLHTEKSLLILGCLSFSWLHCVTEMLQVKFRGKAERKKEKRDHKTCRPVGQTLRHTHPTRKPSILAKEC